MPQTCLLHAALGPVNLTVLCWAISFPKVGCVGTITSKVESYTAGTFSEGGSFLDVRDTKGLRVFQSALDTGACLIGR